MVVVMVGGGGWWRGGVGCDGGETKTPPHCPWPIQRYFMATLLTLRKSYDCPVLVK